MANSTTALKPSDYCTLGTCPLSEANFTYVPTLAGNAAYLAIFAAIMVPQLVLGIRYKTWGFMVGMLCGLVLEIIGYAGRIQLHFNPFPFNPFLEYLICLTIAPAFISAAIYLCLSRIVVVYGENISRIQPRVYTILFVSSDILSLVLQAAGGAISATANDKSATNIGVNVMIAGLAIQVISLFLFMLLAGEYALRVRKSLAPLDERFIQLRGTKLWKLFLIGLAIATVTIFTRCVFRVAELESGFNGALFNDQVAFMILEGPMIIIASLCLTVFHPGVCFKGAWSASTFHIRNAPKKPSANHSRIASLELSEADLSISSLPK